MNLQSAPGVRSLRRAGFLSICLLTAGSCTAQRAPEQESAGAGKSGGVGGAPQSAEASGGGGEVEASGHGGVTPADGGGAAETGGSGVGGEWAELGGAPAIAGGGVDGGEGGDRAGVGGGAAGGAGCVGARPARVRFVSPYVAVANRPSTVIVRGKALAAGGPLVTLNIGATRVGPVAVDSDTQVTVEVPALPVGRYPVTVEGSNCSDAELVVLAPPGLQHHVIAAGGRRERLLWDAERQTLYAVNRTEERIERYQYDAPDWTKLAPFEMEDLTDIALSPNGRSLLVASRGALSEVQLDRTPLVAVPRALNPDSFCGGFFDKLTMTNDGCAFIVFNLFGCSGFTPTYLYDMSSGSLTRNPHSEGYLNSGLAGGSLDGSRVYAGSIGVFPPQPVKVYDALSRGIVDAAPTYDIRAVSVSSNASRVILQDVDVYTRDLSLLGHFSPNAGALASHDSSRAFVFAERGANGGLVVHDLTAAPGADGFYPPLHELELPDPFRLSPGAPITLAGTHDDSAVFISGDDILVVPVP